MRRRQWRLRQSHACARRRYRLRPRPLWSSWLRLRNLCVRRWIPGRRTNATPVWVLAISRATSLKDSACLALPTVSRMKMVAAMRRLSSMRSSSVGSQLPKAPKHISLRLSSRYGFGAFGVTHISDVLPSSSIASTFCAIQISTSDSEESLTAE